MNILPKKRWHVRTRENIARVRKDEAQAAEEEKERQRRVLLAEQEARTDVLRKKARERYNDGSSEEVKPSFNEPQQSTSKHVNFFEDLEEGRVTATATNPEHEKEAKEEKEKYEKSIGYLTYLGQNTVESTGVKPWWDKVPLRLQTEDQEESKGSKKTKATDDPLNTIRRYVGVTTKGLKRKRVEDKDEKSKKAKKSHKKKHKHKRRKRYSSSSSEEKEAPTKVVTIEQLRAERLQREQNESKKAKLLLAKVRGDPLPDELKPKVEPVPSHKQKYNSQFNPHLARQNYEDDERDKR